MGSIAGLVASLDSGKTPINKEISPEDGEEELPCEESRQDGHPHPEQDDCGVLVAEWKHGGAGHWEEELRQQL